MVSLRSAPFAFGSISESSLPSADRPVRRKRSAVGQLAKASARDRRKWRFRVPSPPAVRPLCLEKAIAIYPRLAYQETHVSTLSLETLNRMDRAEFARSLGTVFENSSWVAARAWDGRPFSHVDARQAAMTEVGRRAGPPERLCGMRGHPRLAANAA